MTPEYLQNIRWFKSNPLPLSFDTTRIDRENGVLHDVVMVEEGPAKGHDVHLEAEFVEELVAYDQKHYTKRGLKNRYDHPQACAGTMGTQMGYFHNIRLRDKGGKKQAIADLHLLDAADLSPTQPNMKAWMIQMAEEAPDFVMQSIVFKGSGYYQRNDKGEKERMKIAYDERGRAYWENYDSKKKLFVEFGKKGEHYYTDTVEAGAATDALFSTEANPHLFVSKALTWLDEHPELKDFARKHPEKVQAFVTSLGITNNPAPADNPKKSLTMTSLKELFFGKDKPADDVALTPDQVQELRDKLALAEQSVADAQKNLSAAQEEVKQLKASLATKETELGAATARVTELEKLAADVHTKGPRQTEELKEEKTPAYLSDPATATARRSYEAMQKNKKAA